MTLTEELRASTRNYFTRPWLLARAADEIDRLEALVERDHFLIARLERTLLADAHIPQHQGEPEWTLSP